MKSKLVAIMLCLCFSLAGCVSKESHEMVCGGGEPLDNIWWGDAHQWNGAPMSYGNTTNWTINTTSDAILHLNIDVEAWFSEDICPMGQGYLNISVIQNETLWENETSEDSEWNISLPVNASQEVWIEIRASGKDTHPDNDYGDYFLVKFNGKTTTPQWCE